MVPQDVDVASLDVSRLVVDEWRRGVLGHFPVWLSDRELDLLGNVRGVGAPCPQVEGAGSLTTTCLLLEMVDGAASAQRLGRYLLHPAVRWDALDPGLDLELPGRVGGVEPLRPWREVEFVASVDDGGAVKHPLLECRLGEDYQELLRVMFDHLDVLGVEVKPIDNGVTDVVDRRIATAGVEPAYDGPADEVVAASSNGAGRRDRAGCTWVPRRHGPVATDHLSVGSLCRYQIASCGGEPSVWCLSLALWCLLILKKSASRTLGSHAPR